MQPLYAYLTMTVGHRAGHHYSLDPEVDNRIGRGTECSVMLTDPLCSRVHAVVWHQPGGWRVRDASSRNGTFVNDQKADEATLADGHYLRVGSTEFAFHESPVPPPAGPASETNVTQTLVKDAGVGELDSRYFAVSALNDAEHARDLLLLYQLCIKLLGTSDPQALLPPALDLLRMRTRASVVGFLWIDDLGRLQPKLIIPEAAADSVRLNESLTRLVCNEKRAVWFASQQAAGGAGGQALEHYADALCVPLVEGEKVLGAVHVYLDHGRFRQPQFDFAISLANITAVALGRALHEVTLATDLERLKAASPGFDELVGESSPMLDLKAKITRLARTSGCVLVRGESGTGKELIARALHRASPRSGRPLLAVNCAAMPSELVDSQLFGHKAGAFTSADRDHVGLFQQADLGTLFLDEIGEMNLAAQAKLLRVLEGHPFMPVGGTQEVNVDVRVIVATNRDLASYVSEKKFREDLYYRLNVFELVAPPLRERAGDIGLLADYFLAHFSRLHARPGLTLSTEARARLLTYPWPGNVRQLRNVIDSAVVLAAGERIEAADLGLRESGSGDLLTLKIDDWERKLIGEALKRTRANIPEAARLLGIGRATLYRKMEEYAIPRARQGDHHQQP
ncbi:MAG TPA: sigma 54-interacting transcriptional regulator [Pirellulales bacterium]|jgi:Nif-specific regulatory protein|nr:sigma 54-interacting transcriptional regulator [Pirellulales bacterium]